MIDTEHLSPDTEVLATELATHADYRVLRRVPDPYSSMPDVGSLPDGKCIAIVDTETSGLNPQHDTIIELAIMLVIVDEDNEVIGHVGPFSWLQDPGRELDPRITLLTGLGAQHLQGGARGAKDLLGLVDQSAGNNKRHRVFLYCTSDLSRRRISFE